MHRFVPKVVVLGALKRPLSACGCAQLTKRNVTVRDDSGTSIDITLWGAAVANPGDMLEEVRPHRTHLLPCRWPFMHGFRSA